jgi:hypothetical protein
MMVMGRPATCAGALDGANAKSADAAMAEPKQYNVMRKTFMHSSSNVFARAMLTGSAYCSENR